jgi:UDP:flavonoid glycosyltransferase YjiC (YdhE family)
MRRPQMTTRPGTPVSRAGRASRVDPACRAHAKVPSLRVLWVPYAQRGSLYPVAPVIQELRACGADVAALGPSRLSGLVDAVGARLLDSAIDFDWSSPGRCDRHQFGPAAGREWLTDRVIAEYAETSEACQAFRPDVLLIDSFVIGASLFAESAGAARASYVHYLFDQGAHVDAMHRVWWESLGPEPDGYFRWWNLLRQAVGLGAETRPAVDAPWYRMSPQRTFLLGHPHLRRGDRVLPPYVTRTSLPPWDEPGGAASGLLPPSRQRPVVLLANSSAWQDDIALVRATLDGLADEKVTVVATISAEHPCDFDVPANAAVHGYTPHTSLLPFTDIVVSTAGYGLVTKALWHGVPLVVAPRGRDQSYVAEAAARLGSGTQLPWPPEPAAVRAAVATALDGMNRPARQVAGPVPGYPGTVEVAQAIAELAGARP